MLHRLARAYRAQGFGQRLSHSSTRSSPLDVLPYLLARCPPAAKTRATRIEHLRSQKTKSGRLGACAASSISHTLGRVCSPSSKRSFEHSRTCLDFSLVATNGWCSIASIPKRGSNLPTSGHFANDLSMARDPLVSSSSRETRSETGFSAFSALAMELEKRRRRKDVRSASVCAADRKLDYGSPSRLLVAQVLQNFRKADGLRLCNAGCQVRSHGDSIRRQKEPASLSFKESDRPEPIAKLLRAHREVELCGLRALSAPFLAFAFESCARAASACSIADRLA